MESALPAPRLPPDLERDIFELSAFCSPGHILTLLLVAWRVKTWVEPILYRIILTAPKGFPLMGFPVIPHETLLEKMNNPESLEFHSSVRNLFIEPSLSVPTRTALVKFLSTCTRVTVLGYSDPTPVPIPNLLADKHCLQRLTINIDVFLDSSPDLPLPSLTHLELLDTDWSSEGDPPPAALWTRLALIPNLTHLAVNGPDYDLFLSDMPFTDSRLRCIVFFCDDIELLESLTGDDRLVYVRQHKDYRLDWIQGINGENNYWSLADAFIAARRAGKIDRSQFNISDADRGIVEDGRWL
ncbi:hypothetical protein C8R46DRAFT_1099260 [Mycena filopes]|nr:hypothetical protein C8R46DRAFT_1099260 [Mycena filopes]